MNKKRADKLRRYYKYYWFYFVRERISQILNLIIHVLFVLITFPYVLSRDLWEAKKNISKIPTRKQCKDRLIEMGIENE